MERRMMGWNCRRWNGIEGEVWYVGLVGFVNEAFRGRWVGCRRDRFETCLKAFGIVVYCCRSRRLEKEI